ncbi:MAG: hypothetical protein JNK37_08920 [Verrucomicrobiales bacterium]|nr:hypothetical protein [Verrucomicrobiales bacterium]
MRSSINAAVAALLLAAGLSLPHRATAQSQDPAIPTGTLSAYPSVVQTGTFPTLSWGITYPSIVTDIVTVTPPGTVTPKRTLDMDVRVIGASVKRVWLNSWGQVVDWEWVQTQASISVNNSSYSQIWFNTQNNVNPNTIVHTRRVYNNQPIRFAGRYVLSNGSWSTQYTSTSSTGNVRALKHGDTPPTTTPLYQQPTLESFLLPYLDSQGKIKIGPKDIIYLFELTHTDPNHGGYDLQDLVLLCTFREV